LNDLCWRDYADDRQKVIDVQWALAERGPKVEELLSNPLARDAFSPQNVASMFGALDRDPKHVKAQILSDILRLERAQLANGAGAGESELDTTKVIREVFGILGSDAGESILGYSGWSTVGVFAY
jgi:hypothetical protein